MAASWLERASATIDHALREWLQQEGLTLAALHRLTDAQRQSLLAAVDKAYPFERRLNHPYKQWLKARRDLVKRLGGAVAPAEATGLFALTGDER